MKEILAIYYSDGRIRDIRNRFVKVDSSYSFLSRKTIIYSIHNEKNLILKEKKIRILCSMFCFQEISKTKNLYEERFIYTLCH